MYEDAWYSFVPDTPAKKDEALSQGSQNNRRESLLKQPNDVDNGFRYEAEPLSALLENNPITRGPPDAALARRARSYTDFYHVARAHLTKDSKSLRQKEQTEKPRSTHVARSLDYEIGYDTYEHSLLDASQEEFRLYREQLALSERHLDMLLEGTSSALDILAGLSDSFKTVESQTTAFQAQCEDLLGEQKRLTALADEIGTDLQYYSYLEPITRRLNAPGASRMIGDDSLVEMLTNLDACIEFMANHPEHRESETYLARYRSLLQRTLNLVQLKFTNIIRDKVSAALKRIPPKDKLTMTSIFIIQAPTTHPTENELEETMLKVIRQASLANDDGFQSSMGGPPLAGKKEAENVYFAMFQTLMKEYIAARGQIMNVVLTARLRYLTEGRDQQFEGFTTWSHACLSTAIDICSNEYAKYCQFFGARPGLWKYGDQAAFKLLRRDNIFEQFLNGLVAETASCMAPGLDKMAIHEGVALSQYLEITYRSSMADEDDGSEPHEVIREDDQLESDAEFKSRIAGALKVWITNPLLKQMREILRRDVHLFVAQNADLQIRWSEGQGPAGEAEDGVGEHELLARAMTALGPGFQYAYRPVRTGVKLLMLFKDLSLDSQVDDSNSEMVYEILHTTCAAIIRGVDRVQAVRGGLIAHLFGIKNLLILKNLVQAYEISGTLQAAAIDFTRMWTTFSDLQGRGALFDLSAYYKLIRNGDLFPQVVTSVRDARVELDGLLREEIQQFRKSCVRLMWDEKTMKEIEGSSKYNAIIQAEIHAAFEHEGLLKDQLWSAVTELLREKRSSALP